MPPVGDAITIGVREGAKAGRQIIVKAKGRPANILAYALAAGIVAVGVGTAYGVKHLIGSRGNQGELPEPR